MKIFDTNNTADEFNSLLKDAKDFLILICPFISVKTQTEKRYRSAIDSVHYSFIVTRPNDENNNNKYKNNITFLNSLANEKCGLGKLDGLHAKIYMNETKCLVTSLNLIDSTQTNNYEIGILIEREINPGLYYDVSKIALEIIEISSVENKGTAKTILSRITIGKLYAEIVAIHEEKIKSKYKNKNNFYEALCKSAKIWVAFDKDTHYKDNSNLLLRETEISYGLYLKLFQKFSSN
ncbi:MAG: hypothetical protein ABI388_08505 [Bacteroidia bacterium]